MDTCALHCIVGSAGSLYVYGLPRVNGGKGLKVSQNKYILMAGEV